MRNKDLPDEKHATERFSGLAEDYSRFRPDYPSAAFDFICCHAGLSKGSIAVDVGCGTGISSRLLLERDLDVLAIEPNLDMREQAKADCAVYHAEKTRDNHTCAIEFRAGTAEETGLPDGFADLVLCAQSFHWFDPDAALREFQRILKNGSYCALVWNERDHSDLFTREYGEIIKSSSKAARLEMQRGRAGYNLLASDRFEDGTVREFDNEQKLDENGLLGRALSTSYFPRVEPQRSELLESLKSLFARSQSNNRVILRYKTTVYLARRA